MNLSTRSMSVSTLLAVCAATVNAQFSGFTSDIVTDVSAFAGEVVDMTTGDIDGDGISDVVYLTTNGRVAAFPGAANGQLSGGADTLIIPDASDTGRAIALFDFDNNGTLDLMRADTRDGGSLRIYKNDGQGNFAFDFATIGLGSISQRKGLSMGDFDGDSDQDAYVLTDDGVTVVLNTGGSFSLTPVVSTYINFTGRRLAVADFDGDGRDDAAAYSTLNSQVYILEAGPFGLADSDRIAFANGVNDLKSFDIDKNGTNDLVITGNATNDTIAVYRNLGGANFQLAYTLIEQNPDEVEIVDIDGDGDCDLLVESQASTLSSFSERVIVYTNNGSGVFNREEEEWFFGTQYVLAFDVVDMVQSTGYDIVGIYGTNLSSGIQRVSLRLNATPFTAPGTFSQVSPSDGSIDLALPGQVATWGGAVSPTLSWERAPGLGVTYSVRIDDDPSFASPEFVASGLTGKTVDISSANLLQSTTYFWEVEATNAVGSQLSVNGPFSFLTAPGPTECFADINGDGIVDQGDIQSFIALFLAGC